MKQNAVCDVTEALVRSWLPARPAEGHKGTFGRVNLLAGSVGFTGAPVLASRAAVRGGCGLVFLGVPAFGEDTAYRIVAGSCVEAMPYPVRSAEDFLDKTKPDAALVGPGLGQSPETEALVPEVLAGLRCPAVVDADGINILSRHISVLNRRDAPTVLTPHDGEFQRLTGRLPGPDRAAEAAAFAQTNGCVLVLKGHRTLTAAPDGTLYRNTTGNDGMAKGGSGDVLAGLLTSLLAQGMEPVRAAAAAVWVHGRAGDLAAERFGHRGMTPSDLIGQLPTVWRELETPV
ncbi:MAG: NAD(P)H-hydrate dehydratase [Clostridiales bacterium]|nr:NAD(P)H-hydrate dehydratase [Clostridiales bacterium]